ncbi:hypothetical protein [Neorhizobium sp. NCHU2750]|uniref:hypothetical protein n=1 Tax=Neorhizobium sp. NCHU2750 TaxID=1825976 RepID=UPI000E751F56|nr:membrane protein [Neorhizobium sp. NCHU2750]
MKKAVALLVVAVALAGCTTGGLNSAGLNPIPGSITYGGQPRTKLTKSPIGSTFTHNFYNQWGEQLQETYVILPDRSLKIIERHVIPEPLWD